MNPDFTRKLLGWNKKQNVRLMPWKGEIDPYRIWLSEVILQQTRVKQGLNYYKKFVKAFPSIELLAKAPDQKVFKMWEGLGYYSRCKNLLSTARQIVNKFNGKFPSTYEELKKLKGIGSYTASAIASFAFNEPRAVVDGNVLRILSRYFGISTTLESAAGKKMYNDLAQALLDANNSAVYNQAIMDFGALICKPKNPLCHQCVQQKDCEAFKHDLVKLLPVKEKKLVKKKRWFYYLIVEVNEKIYIRKRTGKDIWQNLHEFVLLEAKGPVSSVHDPLFLQKMLGGAKVIIRNVSKVYKHELTHQSIQGQFITVVASKPIKTLHDYHLINKKKLKQFAFPQFINAFLDKPIPRLLP
jgi:A/G-specific adenine glycosylase